MRRTLCTWAIVALAALAPVGALASDTEDKAAAEQIATVLRDSGQLNNYSVGVKYRDGTVWLSGRVTSDQQMQAALDIVSELEGIEQIVNNLSVGGGSGLQQPLGTRSTARRTSYNAGAEMEIEAQAPAAAGREQPQSSGREAIPVGYHALGGKHKFMRPMAMYAGAAAAAPAAYDQPHMPNYAWPSYAAYPNYAALTYPKQYSATAFPFIGPFYPYPQVPLGWRKVSLEWDDGWWFLDFHDRGAY
jgi:hypothetical protein